jgi:lysine biosynthesis protein LysW
MLCPCCGAVLLILQDSKDGEIISCSNCGAELEVHINRGVLTVSELQIEGEDWGE